MKNTLPLCVAGLAALLWASPGLARDQASAPAAEKPVFRMYDANADGRITRAEYDARCGAWFVEIDADADGFLAPEEYAAYQRDLFQKVDVADRDGLITLNEYLSFLVGPRPKSDVSRAKRPRGRNQAGASHHFQAMDITGDQLVRPVEFVAHWTEVYERMDADADGGVTAAEWSGFQEKRFKEFDADKNGKVTKEELLAAPPPGGGGK